MRYFLLLFGIFLTLNAALPEDEILKKQIGRMLVVGFPNVKITKNSQIVKDMQKYDLGGVILFDKFYNNRKITKYIHSPKQLKKLTAALKSFTTKPLIISLDQEGGKVARLKPSYGFSKIHLHLKSQRCLQFLQKIYM